MKIKEFSIVRYGPLPNTGRILLHNFNLFWGKNEDGKTLTIDALIKILLGRNIREFEHIDRVEENPEGYIIIEDDKGKEIKLPEKGILTKIADLTSSECCNIFIVRNSNLSIARDVAQESEFYTNVTDRLTGLRTGEIIKIKNKLQEFGKLTRADSNAELSDKKEYGNIKSRVNSAYNLREKIDVLLKKIKIERLDELEEESVRQKDEKEKIDQQLKMLEDARRREEYEKGKEALDNLKNSLEKLKGLEIYNEEDERLWRDCERDIKTYCEEKEKILTDLQKNEEESKETSGKLSEVERDFRIFDERKKKLDEEIRPELKTYEIKSGELVQQEGKNKFFTSVGIISAILLGISLLGIIFSPSLLFYILVVLFSISAVISGIFKFQFVRNKGWLAGVFERIKLTLSKFGMDAENIEGIQSNIQKFNEEYQKRFDELQNIRKEKEKFEEKIGELRNKKIPEIENKIKNAQKRIDEIKTNSRVDSLKEYSEKLRLKSKIEKSIENQESILKSHLEKKNDKREENILYWEEEIRKLEEYKDKAKNIKYNENEATKLTNKKQDTEKELQEIKDKMKSIQEQMEEIQRRANEILQQEKSLYCKTSVDLGAIKNKLDGFIRENETNKDNVLKVIKIFEEIEAEEKGKISDLFGKESPISKYFYRITDGLYEEVTFDQEISKIEVKREDGVILEAEKLSGGAYDQLYFSIRLALGEKLLKGKKGFFIMDDPFIKADPDRLLRQIETLKKIAESGWQIIYFSAKGEIKEILKEEINCGAINYVELPRIFS